MTRKTEIVSATSELDGDDAKAVVASFALAVESLEHEAIKQDREILFDTLEVSIERDFMEDRSLAGYQNTVSVFMAIQLRAQGVKNKR
jgi:hypothetical protein